ncbi:MAG: DoxX family protein [Bacteroidetes bacterium]|nr:DoxX family protein [Bacteroidota bacterium]
MNFMKTNRIIYWTSTILVAGMFLMSSIMYLSHNPTITGGFRMLGYPPYFVNILGVAKLLGAIAVLQTKYAKLKEWAYAGFTITLIGATWTHIATGTSFMMPLVIFALLAVSYFTWNYKLAVPTLQRS